MAMGKIAENRLSVSQGKRAYHPGGDFFERNALLLLQQVCCRECNACVGKMQLVLLAFYNACSYIFPDGFCLKLHVPFLLDHVNVSFVTAHPVRNAPSFFRSLSHQHCAAHNQTNYVCTITHTMAYAYTRSRWSADKWDPSGDLIVVIVDFGEFCSCKNSSRLDKVCLVHYLSGYSCSCLPNLDLN